MELIDLCSLFTVLAFASFIGIVGWTWSSRRDTAFSQAARIPLEDDDRPPAAPAVGHAKE
jgi:cytochrome c oxidase cbb3-type subunit 4